MKPLLVTSYVNPDLDGVSCVFAYSELLAKSGATADVRLLGEPIPEVFFMFKRLGLELPPPIPNAHGYEKIILLDASEVHLLEGQVPVERVVEVIDHRKVTNADKFTNAKIQIELVGAAATLVAERFAAAGAMPSRNNAALLHAAIISNTMNFHKTIATGRDLKMAERLAPVSGLGPDFWRELFAAKSDFAGEKLEKAIKGDAAKWRFKNGSVGMGQLEMIGAGELLRTRQGEALKTLWAIGEELGLDYVLLNVVDIGEDRSYFLAANNGTRQLFEKVLEVGFRGAVAVREGMMLRKQILPFLKAELDA